MVIYGIIIFLSACKDILWIRLIRVYILPNLCRVTYDDKNVIQDGHGTYLMLDHYNHLLQALLILKKGNY